MKASGKTTRLLDRFIQDYFNNGVVFIYENRDEPIKTKKLLLDKFLRRLTAEHNVNYEHYKGRSFRENGIRFFKVVNLDYDGRLQKTK